MNIEINTDFIRLDQLLKFAGVVGCGSQAKALISDGFASVNGQVETQRGKKIRSGDRVIITYPSLETELHVVNLR